MSSLSILALALIQALALLALAPLFSGISRVLRAKIHSRSGPDIFQDYRAQRRQHCEAQRKAKAAQLLKVPLRRRIQIHRGIHCRSGQLGTGAGQYCGGQHIVSQSVCQLGKDVRSGGGDHRQISPFGQSNVLHLKRVGAVEGIDRHTPLGNPLKGVGRNKMERVGGHDDVDRSARLDQRARKSRRFIGRNAARNTQQNIFSFQHPVFPF